MAEEQHTLDLAFTQWSHSILDQGWAYRIEKLSNADISDFSVYRRVYRIEPPISSISIFSIPVIFLSFFVKNSPKIQKIPRKFWKPMNQSPQQQQQCRKFQKFAENSENSPKILRKFSENSENSENPWTKVLNNNNNNNTNAENSKNSLKILKKNVFFEALISHWFCMVLRKTLISYRVKKKFIAHCGA